MNLKMKSQLAGLTLAGLLSACASGVPLQLIEARDAYAASSTGLAAKLTPTELYDAKKALDQANLEYDANGDTTEVRDYAYIAARKIALADVKARTEVDRQEIAAAQKQGVQVRDDQVKSTQAALAHTREQLRTERTANEAETTELKAANTAQGKELEKNAGDLEKAAGELGAEKEARATAEQRLAGAMKDLAAIVAIKEEARGLVITLSGSVLFASGKFALLESAKTKLDQVAEALKAQNEDKTMLVEGHTDSRGSDAINLPLSRNRANAVREYLITRGVDANKIRAVGLGKTRPLLDNNTAENRANNRRVEIVIQTAALTTR